MYRVTAISELPTESTPVVVTVGTHTRRAWLLGDDGTKAHLILDMELATTHSHELVLAEYETGRCGAVIRSPTTGGAAHPRCGSRGC